MAVFNKVLALKKQMQAQKDAYLKSIGAAYLGLRVDPNTGRKIAEASTAAPAKLYSRTIGPITVRETRGEPAYADVRARYDDGGRFEATWRQGDGRVFTARGETACGAIAALRAHRPKTFKRRGEIVAYRVWTLSGGYLGPVATKMDTPFTGPICQSDRQPEMGDTFGLHSVKASHLDQYRNGYAHRAYGTVGCYGRVIEHEGGYRSEYQIIHQITLVGEFPEWFVKGIADQYQCDVTVEPTPASKGMGWLSGFVTIQGQWHLPPGNFYITGTP